MAVTLVEKTQPGRSVRFRGQPKGEAGQKYVTMRVVEITFDNSYLTGGEPIDLGQIGFDTVVGAIIPPASGYVFSLDVSVPTAPKVLVFRGDWPNAGAAPLIEVTNAFDLSAVVARALIFGVS
jgi:hypothetical protein